MPKRRSRWIRVAVACGGVALASFAIVESVLRITVADSYATLYRPDPRTLYRLAPGSQKVFQRLGEAGVERIQIAINHRGFRGDPLLPLGSARRVVVYGDSFVAAEYSSLEETFAEQLEGLLTQRFSQASEVVNAGVVGYGPDQALLRMRDEIAWLEPELVILVVFAGNDFGDLLRNKLFRRGEAGELTAAPARVVGRAALNLRFAPYTPVLYRVLARAYYAFTHQVPSGSADDAREAQARRIDEWLQQREAEWQSVRAGDLGVTNLFRDTPDVDLSTAPTSASAVAKLELMELVLAGFRDTTSRAGVPLLLLIVPSAIDACPDYALARIDSKRFPAYRPETATSLLVEMADRLQIPRLDLFGPFRRNDPCELFFQADPHWNAAGQKLAAQLAADAIGRRGLWRANDRARRRVAR